MGLRSEGQGRPAASNMVRQSLASPKYTRRPALRRQSWSKSPKTSDEGFGEHREIRERVRIQMILRATIRTRMAAYDHLMDDSEDGATLQSQLADHVHHKEGRCRVEARGGLVKEQQSGLGDELACNCQPPLLPARDPLEHPVADESMLSINQTHGIDHVLRALDLFRVGHGGGKAE